MERGESAANGDRVLSVNAMIDISMGPKLHIHVIVRNSEITQLH